jgi:hypothetical protein
MPGVGGHVMIDEITPEAVSEFVRPTGPRSGSPLLSSEIRHLGGAAGRPAPGGGALSHLEGDGAVFVVGVPMHPEHHELLLNEVDRIESRLAAFGHGRLYRNFTEAPRSAGSFHADDRVARLRALRRRFDPATQVMSNHPIDREPVDL